MTPPLAFAALALLVAAATTDAIGRRIPNGLAAGLALVGLARIGLGLWNGEPALSAVADLTAAAVIFALGAVGFRFGVVGGGDVKLLAAATLWLGATSLMPFLTATALAGGLLAVLFLAWTLIGPGRGKVALPYGIAIAAGGIFVTGGSVWG